MMLKRQNLLLIAGSGGNSNIHLSTTASPFSDCSSLSHISLSAAAPVLSEKDSRFSNETHSSGRDDMTTQRPFCRAPKIICLPSNSVGNVSESSESNVGTSHCIQETTDVTNHRKLAVPPRRASFKDVPTTAYCTSCGTQVLTYTKYRASSMTWALAGLLCAFGCHLGCCLAPFFCNSVKGVVHLCPLCSTELGMYAKG